MASSDPTKRRRFEFLYFAVRNVKLIVGLSLVLLFVLIALIGPLFVKYSYTAFFPPFRHPSAQYWLGTNYFGNDVFSEFVYGLRESLFVGILAGCGATVIGMTFGFIAGYKGGMIDEGLNVLTNVLLTLPTLVLLILVAGFLKHTSALTEAILIACTTWTWSMRAIRAQTFSLVARDFVGLARLSGEKSWSIIVREIAPNMSSYLFLVFILLFGSSILTAAGLDFLGLGPPNGMSLGIMMNQASDWSALPASSVVVVHPARRRHHRRRRRPLPGQCGSRRGLQPEAAGALGMALKVDHLRVCYRTLRGDVNAVDDVSFEIVDGEIMGLAGESGCGKSTLGNSLVRMDVRMRVVGGGAELDGQELPLSDDKAMREFRFKQVSIVPQYAMSALNPTRRIGKMVSELLKSRGINYKEALPEFERRVKLVGLDADVLYTVPDRALGRDEAAHGHGHLDAPQSFAADRRRGHLGPRRLHPAGRRRDADRVPGAASSSNP